MLRFALFSFPGISSLKLEDIVIPESEYPIWIKEGQYDIFLLYSEYNTEEALNFADFLGHYMGRRVCLMHNYKNVQWKRNKFNSLEDAVSSASSIIDDSPVHALSVLKAQIERLIVTKEEQRKLREVMYKEEIERWLPAEQLRMNQQQKDSGITHSIEVSPEGEYYFYVQFHHSRE